VSELGAALPLQALAALALAGGAEAAAPPSPLKVHADHNPILSRGDYYSTDPAPLVVGDTLYILTGRDEAPIGVNDFIMNEWQLLATRDVGSGDWLFYPHLARPEQIFRWAAPGRAYAGQIIQGPDRRFYFYAPVLQAHSADKDGFAIGVAVSDSPLGPWTDAHPAGPIISQSTPVRNSIQNIDPTPFVDGDGRVYIYWGTFGRLRGMELARDMVTPKGPELAIDGLTGFFEAPWLFKRKGVYYLAYAANNAGPTSNCTPAIYHACIAYGTSRSPLGPWTYRGVILPPVSSTTSHPGFVAFKGKWYIVYHTADAANGGHFRRSVAIDELRWDDSVNPPAMLQVRPTPEPPARLSPQRNLAPAARSTASNVPVPVRYWIHALNDAKTPASPLPPDLWSDQSPHAPNPPRAWIEYQWDRPVRLNGSRLLFWADHPAGSSEGLAPPRSWRLEYFDRGAWVPVRNPSLAAKDADGFVGVAFRPVTTRCLRAVLEASSDGRAYAGLAVEEWEALAPEPRPVEVHRGTAAASPACADR
jgi:hypothetical protein